MKSYQDTPGFLSAMSNLMDICWYNRETSVHTMVDMRLLLMTYNWGTFCRHVELYQEFDRIVHEFLDYILYLVTDHVCNIYDVIVRNNDTAAGGVSRETYYEQKHLILTNMGDAGVVQCMWTVCRYHRTNIPLQATMLDILYQMTTSPGVRHVKDVLKEPINMLILEDILASSDFGAPGSEQRQLFHDCSWNYASLVKVMLP